MRLQLIEQLRRHAIDRPDALAIAQAGPCARRPVSWEAMWARVDALSRVLRGALPAGAVVILCSANRAEFSIAFVAGLEAGLSVFPIAPDVAAPELAGAARRTGAAAVLVIGQIVCGIEDCFALRAPLPAAGSDAVFFTAPRWEPRTAPKPALLLQSSGTTSQPKIVRRDGAALDAVADAMVDAIGFTPRDRVLAAAPLCHSYGIEHGLLAPLWAGSEVHLLDGFDLTTARARLLDAPESAVTIVPGVPFMFEMLCASAQGACAPPALRRVYSAGGPLPLSIFEQFLKLFGTRVSQLYGATEIGSVLYNDPKIEPFNPASVGRPMKGVRVRILDPERPDPAVPLAACIEGHVAIAAPSVLSGYIDASELPLLDGHFLTGDLGRLDASGALTLSGRIKLLIDIGGRKVNPLEVEETLRQHPLVGDCAVVALRVSPTLNRLKAIVTPREPEHDPELAALRSFLRERLSAYKVPRIFEVRQSLPRTPLGKVHRQVLEDETNARDAAD